MRPRGWLVRVARNVALGGLRARRRRAEHEAEATRRELAESPAESAARVEALQRVGTAILALEEPYRMAFLVKRATWWRRAIRADASTAEFAPEALGRAPESNGEQLAPGSGSAHHP